MADKNKTNILPVRHTMYVLERLDEQRRRGTFCDAVLIVEGKKFKVHRSLLAANSDYFLSLFTSAEEQHNFVLAGVPLQGFRVILDFIYSSTFVLDLSNIHDVHKASTVLNFKHVQAACEKVFVKIRQLKEVNFPFQTASLCNPTSTCEKKYQVGKDQNGETKNGQHSPKNVNFILHRSPLSSESDFHLESNSIKAASPCGNESTILSCDEMKQPLLTMTANEVIIKESTNLIDNEQQSRPLNLKRKVKLETVKGVDLDENSAKRIKKYRSNTNLISPNLKAGETTDNSSSKFSSPLFGVQPVLSDSFNKTESFDERMNKHQVQKQPLTLNNSNSDQLNSDSRSVSPISSEATTSTSENGEPLSKRSLDLTSTSSYENEIKSESSLFIDEESQKNCSFLKKEKSSLSTSSTVCSRKEKFEALCSQWKVNQRTISEKNRNTSDCSRIKAHRNRRKMLKTNKVLALTEESATM